MLVSVPVPEIVPFFRTTEATASEKVDMARVPLLIVTADALFKALAMPSARVPLLIVVGPV